jgi:hypothetical protein
MSRGLDIEKDDSRDPTSLRDHRKEERVRPVEKPLPKEVEVWRLDRDAIPVDRELPERDARDSVSLRGAEYRLRESEVDTLQDIGRFRVADEADLQRFGYTDNSTRMREDIRSLRDQGLVERRRIGVGGGGYIGVLSLTDQGRKVAETLDSAGSKQRYYDGFVKPTEIEHDSALYRMFQAEASKIQQDGGRVKRVVLDFELKHDVYAELAEENPNDAEAYRERQQLVATANHLSVVRGHVQFPDLRIEYENAHGQGGRVDVELTTDHYKKSQIAAKAAAGFTIYSLGGDSSGAGSGVREERELTSQILSL